MGSGKYSKLYMDAEPDFRVWQLIISSKNLLSKYRSRELLQYGIPRNYSWVLNVAKYLGDDATPSKIVRYSSLEKHSLSEMLKRMEKRGLITRQESAGTRERVIRLTEKGLEAQKNTRKREAIHRAMSVLNEEEIHRTINCLEKIANNVTELLIQDEEAAKARKAEAMRNAMEKQVTEVKIKAARLSIVQGDITRQATDAIVNAANSSLMGGGGVDGAIHRAGGPAILEECKKIVARQGRLPTGKAVITTGGNLESKYVIHTVGPVWHGGKGGEPELLASAYRESLKLAAERKLTGISFPSISTGAYGYPVDEAAKVAMNTAASFLKETDSAIREVVFVLYDSSAYQAYGSALKELANTLK